MRLCVLIGGTRASVKDRGHKGTHGIDRKAYERDLVPLDTGCREAEGILFRASRWSGSFVGAVVYSSMS